MIRFSPLTRRRWANFKANRRGYYSLWLFGFIFVTVMCADLLANDKPLVFQYEGRLHFPIFKIYLEREIGGDLPIEAEYKDPYVQNLILESGGWMIWPPIRYSYRTIDRFVDVPVPMPPSRRHWLGTDDVAKDVAARLLYGLRLSILFGLTLTFFSSIIGITVGAVQGYFGGWVDLVGQRVVEIWAGLPVLLMLIILASIVEPSPKYLLALLLLFSWMALVNVVRAEFLRARNFDYVRAARALGVSNITIMRKHVFPNAMVATLTFLPFILTSSITILTALDFLGFGLPAGSPSMGELLQQGRNNIHAPWLGLTGFFSLAILLTLLIFIGEAVRDAFDPRRAVQES